jgi:hypothetical protein
MLRLILLLGLAGLAFYLWNSSGSEYSIGPADSPNGFVHAIMPKGAKPNTVWVLAPKNCPSTDAQRANALVERLEQQGIPVVLSSAGSFETAGVTSAEQRDMENSVAVLRGEIPAVFVNGMGMANPSAAEVIAEYHRTK